jgi:O-Antigen ligase
VHVAIGTELEEDAESPAMSDAVRETIARFTLIELALIALSCMLPLAYLDMFLVDAWTPRMALALFALPIGTFLLLDDARRGDAGSIAAVGFLTVCTLSTVVNGVPGWVLHGGFGRESSLVYVLGLFAIWAMAKRASPDATRYAIGAVGIGLVINGLIGVLQVIVKPGSGAFAMLGSRPAALLSNPVYFGACLAAATVWAAHMAGRERVSGRAAVIALSFFAMCVSLSGSRIATAAALVGVGAALLSAPHRARWHIVLGCVAGTAAGIAVTAATDSRGLSERAGAELDGRFDVWLYAWQAFGERPLLGYGFGQFRAAVQPFFEPEFVAQHADTGVVQSWPDAHNLIVQYAIIGGLPAVALLGWFAYSAARTSRGPLAWAALTIAITWLFQPVQLATGPLAMLLLGLSAAPTLRPTNETDEHTEPGRSPTAVFLFLGILLGGSLVGLDNRLNTALADRDASEFTSWARIAPDDPLLAAKAASLNDQSGRDDVGLEWSEITVRLEPFDAAQLSLLAVRRLSAGEDAVAVRHIRAALEIDPWHPEAIRNARVIALVTGDAELENEADYRSCVLARFGDTTGCAA